MVRSSQCRALLFAAAAAAWAAPASATEYGLGNYQLGLVLPLAGYMPPPGVYVWDNFYLYQGTGNLYQNSNTRNPAQVTYNFAANIGVLAWFTDATIFGGSNTMVRQKNICAGQLLKLELIDHVVILNGNFSSLRALGYFYA